LQIVKFNLLATDIFEQLIRLGSNITKGKNKSNNKRNNFDWILEIQSKIPPSLLRLLPIFRVVLE